jgi:hypothetical protein
LRLGLRIGRLALDGRGAFGGLLHSGLLEFAEGSVGALVNTVEVGFVAEAGSSAGDHLGDQILFGRGIDPDFLLRGLLFSSELNPCLREFWDDLSRVSWDLGPLDLEPFALDAADFSSDVISIQYGHE